MNRIIIGVFAVILGQSLVFAGPLHDAARDGNLDEVKRLLNSGTDIEELDFSGTLDRTALIVAAMRGMATVVEELLNRGANINYKSALGTALQNSLKGHQMPEEEKKEVIRIIRKWSIENQVKVIDPEDIQILDANDPGSYDKDFAAYGVFLEQRREARRIAVGEATNIPRGPAGIILEYMGKND